MGAEPEVLERLNPNAIEEAQMVLSGYNEEIDDALNEAMDWYKQMEGKE